VREDGEKGRDMEGRFVRNYERRKILGEKGGTIVRTINGG
jgi:hypothetical protein